MRTIMMFANLYNKNNLEALSNNQGFSLTNVFWIEQTHRLLS